MLNIKDALRYGTEQLSQTSESPKLDTECILCFCLRTTREMLMTWPEREITVGQWAHFESYIARRKTGEPVAYIRGQQSFWTFDLTVTEDTLIPRPETELLIELVINLLPPFEKESEEISAILDLGTGSGAIALALAQAFSNAEVIATDKSEKALLIAKSNAEKYQLKNIQFVLSDWFSKLQPVKKFDVIVSNPPYIPEDDPHLKQGDVRFEPLSALVAKQEGLADIYTIIKSSQEYMRLGGYLLLEHGYDQHLAVQEMMQNLNFKNIETFWDLAGHPRVTKGQW